MTTRPPAKPPRAGHLSIIPAAAAFDPNLGKAALLSRLPSLYVGVALVESTWRL